MLLNSTYLNQKTMKYFALSLLVMFSFFGCQDEIQTSSPTLQGLQHGDFTWKSNSRSVTVNTAGALTITGTDGYGTMTIILAAATVGSYELGKDYSMVDNPLPIKKDGVVEVAEAFWYGCNHCYSFESTINNWDAGKPDYVKFSKMPITWSQIHQLHASLYHTIEALKLDKGAHTAVFTTIHKENNFLASQKSVVKFLSKLGVSEDKAKQYLNSFGIKQKVSRDNQLSKQLRITSVPMIIVDGKYIIESKPSRQEMLEVLDYVIELQKSNS